MNSIQTARCEAFLAMNQEEQMNNLQRDGVYIGKKENGRATSLLYQYQTIYVEVHYAVHRSKVDRVICHADTAILDQYTEE